MPVFRVDFDCYGSAQVHVLALSAEDVEDAILSGTVEPDGDPRWEAGRPRLVAGEREPRIDIVLPGADPADLVLDTDSRWWCDCCDEERGPAGVQAVGDRAICRGCHRTVELVEPPEPDTRTLALPGVA